MSRRALRPIKFCAYCGTGFDAFRARDQRGRYCSPECLQAARQAHRDAAAYISEQGPAMIPRLAATPDQGGADSAIA
jgi:hypothetical protein